MSKPTTRAQFKDYCLRKLGHPVVQINVDDDQVEDRIDDALQYYIDRHADGCYLDVDIFCNKGLDQVEIETLSESIKMHLRHFDTMLEDCYMRTQFQSMQAVPTNLDDLQRRNLRFYIKLDWRN